MRKSFSFNFAYDALGVADGRPTTWGTAGFVDSAIRFKNVPAGMRVRLLRFEGTVYAYINGNQPSPTAPTPAPAGSAIGFLAGFLTETTTDAGGNIVANNQASPDAEVVVPGIVSSNQPQSGCPWFYAGSVTAEDPNQTIVAELDLENNENAVIDANNVLLVRQALFLNNTGLPIHMEVSGCIEFDYVQAG